MKIHPQKFSGPLVALALFSAPPFFAADNQTQPPASAPAPQPAAAAPQKPAMAAAPAQPDAPRAIIRLAEHDSKDHTAKKYFGDKVRGSDDRDLGKVKDFLLDPETGRVDFAVIASGGIVGMGEKLHLVPLSALKRAGKKDEFAVNVNEEQWKQLGTLAEDEFKSGEVTVTDEQRRQLAQNFQHGTAPADDSGFYTASLTSHLVRASELTDREVRASALSDQTVRAGWSKLGEIEDVVLDLAAGTAQALVDPNKDFTGTRSKLLVPLNQFTIGSGHRPHVTTLLTRSDFQQLHPGGLIGTGMAASTTSSTPQPAAPQSAAAPATAAPAVASTPPAAGNPPSSTQSQPGSAPAAPAASTKAMPAVASAQPTTDNQKSSAPTAPASAAPTTPAASTSSTSASAAPSPSAVATNASPAPTQTQPQPQATTPAASDPTTSTARVATTEKSPAAKTEKETDKTLSPTGQNSADTIPAGTDPLLLATARAIRKALDDDPVLARADVRVLPEEGKIVLRGRVSDQKTKTAIIEKATSEVKGWKIDDQISLDTR